MHWLWFATGFLSLSYAKPVFKSRDGGYLFEGDMLVTRPELEAALRGADIDGPRGHAYGVSSYSFRKWPNKIVPFTLTSSVKNAVLNVVGLKGPTERAIRGAMEEWEKKTCIRFKERTNEHDYIEFKDEGYGQCHSWVGRIGGPQTLSLGFGCFKFGIALHEIGHALGLFHEQSRPDRDDYVEIIYENINEGMKENFKKYDRHTIDSLGSPYDYDSIMHYESNAFAKWPWQTTIKPKKNVSIGQRSYLSDQDAKQINKYYCGI